MFLYAVLSTKWIKNQNFKVRHWIVGFFAKKKRKEKINVTADIHVLCLFASMWTIQYWLKKEQVLQTCTLFCLWDSNVNLWFLIYLFIYFIVYMFCFSSNIPMFRLQFIKVIITTIHISNGLFLSSYYYLQTQNVKFDLETHKKKTSNFHFNEP